jgi:hypothetical protein
MWILIVKTNYLAAMKNITASKVRPLIYFLLTIFLTFPIFLTAQEDVNYFIKKDTWEETVRYSCDKLNYDWNHKKGKFNYIFYYRHNWESFYDEVKSVLREIRWEFENDMRLQRELSDRLWETDRKSGDYRPVAIKMAWKIDHGFRSEVVEQAENVESWEDFQKIRELYHFDKDLTVIMGRLDREFNEENLLKGIKYLADLNDWEDSFINESKNKIASFEERKKELMRKSDQAEFGLSNEIDEFLLETSDYLKDIFLTNNDLLGTDSLIFLKRFPFQSNHYYTDYVNGCRFYGGNMYSLDLTSGNTKKLIPELEGGIIGRFDLDYDAEKFVFDWKEEQQEGFRIFEKNLATGELVSLTKRPDNEDELIRLYRVTDEYHHGTDDMHPIYLPDGKICFISTRPQYGILCDSPDNFSTTVLYTMDSDGSNFEKLTNSSVSESNPSVMDDGRILYTRWEYLDKGAVSVKCLWAMRPDGTNAVEIFGNTLALPPTLLMGRQIPGSPNLFSCLGTPHCCPQNGVGTVLTIDINKDLRTTEPMKYITPKTDIRAEIGTYQYIRGEWVRTDSGPLYCDPYPLSEKMFLVAHNPTEYFNAKTAWDLYLIDDFGNHILIHRDPEISCWQPIPFKERKRPPVVNSALEPNLKKQGLAAVFVNNVTHGMKGIELDEVKYLRVNEQVPRPWKARRYWPDDEYDQQHALITKDTHLGLKVQHGIVPVEEDGSAYFLVPADKNIFFQVLDENYMELQRERTYTNFRPGEFRSCTGCHERQTEAAFSGNSRPIALQKEPELPGPQPGEESGLRPIDYMTDVQPIWDENCVSCHSGDSPAGGLNLSGELTEYFCVSYENLVPERRKRPRRDPNYLGMIIGENHPKEQNVHYHPPKSLGSHTSKLMKMILAGHSDVELTQEERIRISTWIDSNAQYYGTYFGKKNLKYKNEEDFRPVPTVQSALAE